MTDIVTRLRKEVARAEVDGVLPSWDFAKVVWEAADEIERLRAAIRHLYFNEGVCYGENCEQCGLVFGLCDDKAVRGE